MAEVNLDEPDVLQNANLSRVVADSNAVAVTSVSSCGEDELEGGCKIYGLKYGMTMRAGKIM